MAATRKFIYVLSHFLFLFLVTKITDVHKNVSLSFFIAARVCKSDKDCKDIIIYRYILKCRNGECVKIKI
ncbi:Nodule Cysteine-Rich (NCR) secreted peptide [Medicago truncatula]|uniref:Nodule Cysteine-Rich (NCR) secreted peptide n=1 Tax=Medicago truncatula TaxID=3880 RepID=G7KT88_MEDTR|nr:Nodule Cysteine-Rich (NCR) secreted peptide [Medicago truncatula]